MYMSLITKSNITLSILLSWSLMAFSQFSVERYLSAPFQDAEINGLLKQLEYMDDASFRSPLFRELEVRIRTNDLNASPDDIRLRLGFLNPFEQFANRSYESVQSAYLHEKYEFETNQLLANRYHQLIKHYYLSTYIEMLNAEIAQLIVVYEQMQDQKSSYEDWFETDERILKKQLKVKDVQASIKILEYLMQEIAAIETPILWEGFEFIPVEKMAELMLPDSTVSFPEVDLAISSYELDQEAYKADKAQSWSNIGFIQANYNLNGDKLDEDLGFQMGISLPLFNTDKPKLQRKKLDLIKKEYNIREVREEASLEKYELDTEFGKHLWCYQQVSGRLLEIEAMSKAASYDNLEDLIALMNYHANLSILRHEIYLECLQNYIDALALSGRLSAVPYINYISGNLSPLTF